MIVKKPWGSEQIFAFLKNKYCGKLLTINKGHRLSLQYHKKKHETIYVLKGVLEFTDDRGTVLMCPESSTLVIVPKEKHRFAAPKGEVILIEVSTTELQDVVRIEDDYGRPVKKQKVVEFK